MCAYMYHYKGSIRSVNTYGYSFPCTNKPIYWELDFFFMRFWDSSGNKGCLSCDSGSSGSIPSGEQPRGQQPAGGHAC